MKRSLSISGDIDDHGISSQMKKQEQKDCQSQDELGNESDIEGESLFDGENWLPPPLRDISDNFNSIMYSSHIPKVGDTPLILGVDEAGRGPILGPMVYTVAYCKEDYESDLKRYGFDDSKVLKHEFRLGLYKLIDQKDHELNQKIGYLSSILSAKDISSGMLRVHQGNYNLNEQAHDATINLIKALVEKKVNIKRVYVDTVGPPEKYQAKLSNIFSSYNIKFTVTKKADSLYPIVSCASIIAKVTRDLYLHYYNQKDPLLRGTEMGSGYPSDPRTSRWLKEQINPVFGWHFGVLRYSWQTAKDSLDKNKAVEVDYEAETFTQPFKFGLSCFGTKTEI
ncbi:hypothetical protein CANTEDRAFT_112777 [Yamadazyma tenuis ATCC 10573]|uniref:Ribonuclease n=1 Tax=Candida tenuis (strain ATCC 10573 / BCRC 21748 / CBS 615 / JCM 9827 / NBRC 10315 / NRRL Y-1498 / VKM Y-70) TaxID=590646 RepID=G3AYP8_CANTC|nr:ribonuclease HII [Yamadazyma tenuis ATCC 10573]XP_006684807.1 uncharacterized protein CANTEDRAFT_112777 [Yamadazyma tenuis ATCC 10573]EGV66232.1 ribonuclease HII [Yamadazyma tenuis ATCC 10573]EGV66233.1 hypothetical protein CANTEDRAFT_112777 [Yamadazyma tenuis ATCC 10573]